jgi:DNA repair protein RadC
MHSVVKEYSLKYKPTKREAKQIKDSRTAYEELKEVFDPDTLMLFESFYVLYLKGRKIKGYMKVGEGGMTHVVVDPKRIMMGALSSLATSIIISHNHPSGNPSPSADDRQLTKKIHEACKLMDIVLLDHIIIGDGDCYSFRDNGELFE